MKKILVALTLILPNLAISQIDSINLNQVSVRADGNTPVTQKTITSSDINKVYFGQDMSYILTTQTPSVTAYSDNGLYNSYTYFRLRGIDQTRINMTLNGVPLNEPEDQGVYFSNYPDFASNISSVQVQRGVGISSNGVSSYIGSMNFSGPNLLDTAYKSVESGYGSYNSYRESVTYNSGLQKDGLAVYARYSLLNSNGYKYNGFNKSNTFFTSIGYFGKKDILNFTSFAGTSENGMAYLAVNIDDILKDPRTNYLTPNETDHFIQDFASFQWIHNVGVHSTLNTSIFYNHLDGNYGVLSGNIIDNFRVTSDFVGIISNYDYQKNKFKFDLGVETSYYDRYHMMSLEPFITDYIYNNYGTKTEISEFVKLYYKLTSKIVLFVDLQLRNANFTYHADSGSSNLNTLTWNFFNPKGGIKYITNDHWSFYFSVGQSYREPTRNDLFNGYDNINPISSTTYVGATNGMHGSMGDTVNIQSIKPESVIDWEIGTNLNYKFITLDANLYYMDFTNQITPIGKLSYIGLPLNQNVAKSYRTGVESNMEIRILKNLIFTDNFSMCYSKIKSYTDGSGNIYTNVNPLLTPEFINNNMIYWSPFKNFILGFGTRCVSSSYLDNTENKEFMSPSYFIENGTIGYTISKLNFKFMCNNIGNILYFNGGYVGTESNGNATPAYFVSANRNYYLTVTFKF